MDRKRKRPPPRRSRRRVMPASELSSYVCMDDMIVAALHSLHGQQMCPSLRANKGSTAPTSFQGNDLAEDLQRL